MKTILRKEILTIFKEKGTLLSLLILPIAFIVLFSSIFGGTANSTIKIHYLDQDNTILSRRLVEALNSVNGFEVITDNNSTLNLQKESVEKGKISSLLIIPRGFGNNIKMGKQTNLEFYRTAVADQTVESIKILLFQIINNYRDANIKKTLVKSGKTDIQVEKIMSPPVVVEEINEDVEKISAGTQFVPGMMVMFVFFIIITMIRGFAREKESGMLARLRSTPMKPIDYLVGMWSSAVITVVIQCAILLGFGHFVYHLQIGNLISVTAIIIALAVCATGIGLALSFIVKSENQGMVFTQIIIMGGAALGGLWFPTDLLPDFAQKISRLTPQYWAQTGLQDIIIRGVGINSIALNIAILLAFGAAGIVIALIRYRSYILSAAN